MPTHDYDIANQSGAAFRTDLNNALDAIQSNNSNSTSPATTAAYQWWADTNEAILKIRNSGNNGWINLFTLAGGVDVDAASNFNEDVTFTGASANITFDKSSNELLFADNAKATFGNNGDLVIKHSGSDSFIDDNGTGDLKIRTVNGNGIQLLSGSSEEMITCAADGEVKLFHNGNLSVQTISAGLNWQDSKNAEFGNSGDLKIFHDGNSKIQNTNNSCDFRLIGNSIELLSNSATESYIKCTVDAAVQIFHDNSRKFVTTARGIEIGDDSHHTLAYMASCLDVSRNNSRLVQFRSGDASTSESGGIYRFGFSFVRGTSEITQTLLTANSPSGNSNVAFFITMYVCSATTNQVAQIELFASAQGTHSYSNFNASTPTLTSKVGSNIAAGSLAWSGSDLQYTTNSNENYTKYMTEIRMVAHDRADITFA